MNDAMTLLSRHRSIRRYRDEPVRDDHIIEAVRAGQAASTSSAVQSYGLIRISDADNRRALIELTGGQAKVAEAGAFFVVCGDTRRHRLASERAGVAYDAGLEAFLLAIIDATLFAQNLVVAFESLGYGICYVGGLRNDLAAVDELLQLPGGVYPLYGLCVGVPDEAPPARPRLPLESVYFQDAYPTDERMLELIDEYDATYRRYLQERGAREIHIERSWSGTMAAKFAVPQRADLATYYAGKGASFG